MAKRILLVVGVGLLLTGSASGREYIKITDPNFRPYPLAIPDIKDMSGTAADLVRKGTETLRFDLGIAGVFKVLDPRSFIVDSKQEGLSGASINFADWINVGAEGLIKVGIYRSGKKVAMEGHLFDVASGKELLHKKYKGNAAGLRKMVHRFADAVVRHFTGSPSVFFTKIVFAKKTRRESKEICIMDFDGRNERCMVKNGAINLRQKPEKLVIKTSFSPSGPFMRSMRFACLNAIDRSPKDRVIPATMPFWVITPQAGTS